MPTLDLRLEVSREIAGYLQDEALNRGVPLDRVVGDVLTDYFAELSEDEIVESIRIGMRQAFAGQGRPAREVLAEVELDMREVDCLVHTRVNAAAQEKEFASCSI